MDQSLVEPKSHVGLASAYILQTGLLSRGTGGRGSDRAKAAYKSWRDYIIAVKGKIRLRVIKYPERVGGISTNLVDFVEWRFVMWRCP